MAIARTTLEGHPILVIEAHALAALDTQDILECAGAEVLVVGSPGQALSCLDRFSFSVAVISGALSDGLKPLMVRMRERGLPFVLYRSDWTAKMGSPILSQAVPPDEIVNALAELLS